MKFEFPIQPLCTVCIRIRICSWDFCNKAGNPEIPDEDFGCSTMSRALDRVRLMRFAGGDPPLLVDVVGWSGEGESG